MRNLTRDEWIDAILKIGQRAVYIPHFDAEYHPLPGVGRYNAGTFVYESDRRLIQVSSSDNIVFLDDTDSIVSTLLKLGNDMQQTDRELYALTICAQNEDILWLKRIAKAWPEERLKSLGRKY